MRIKYEIQAGVGQSVAVVDNHGPVCTCTVAPCCMLPVLVVTPRCPHPDSHKYRSSQWQLPRMVIALGPQVPSVLISVLTRSSLLFVCYPSPGLPIREPPIPSFTHSFSTLHKFLAKAAASIMQRCSSGLASRAVVETNRCRY